MEGGAVYNAGGYQGEVTGRDRGQRDDRVVCFYVMALFDFALMFHVEIHEFW